jgi:serine protease inhibitor
MVCATIRLAPSSRYGAEESSAPFLVAIVDVPTGAILFLGHVTDPTDPGSL